MKLRLLSIAVVVLFFTACGDDSNDVNIANSECVAGSTGHIADYINDLKGEKIFVKKGDEYIADKDTLWYGDDALIQRKGISLASEADHYDLYLTPYMLPQGQSVDWSHKHLGYLLLATKPCVLLLEVYQLTKGNTISEDQIIIEIVIWQKHEKQWHKVTKDFFPLEQFKERLTAQYASIKIEDKENKIWLQLVQQKMAGTLNAEIEGVSATNPNAKFHIEAANINSLTWKNGRFDFGLTDEITKELAAVNTGVEEAIELTYSGVLAAVDMVVLTMNLTPKESTSMAKTAYATITGQLEIRGKETYVVDGVLYSLGNKRTIELKLLKNGQLVETWTSNISSQSPASIVFYGGENSTLIPNSLMLCNQKIKDLVLNNEANSLEAYSNEILAMLNIPNGEDAWAMKSFGNKWEKLNNATFSKAANDYQLTQEYSPIKAIHAKNKNHLVFSVSDNDGLYNDGSDQYELSKYGTLQHILLGDKSEQPKVLEIGMFVDTVGVSYPDSDREENGEIIRDTDLNGVYFVSYLRVLERTAEGYWINVNNKVMPTTDKLLKAVQFFYPQLSDIDYFYNYTESIEEEDLPPRVEPLLSYQAQIAGFDGEKTERSFDPSTFQLEWKDNTLYIAGEKGIQLQWEGKQFEMETNAVLNIKTDSCFNVDQLKFNKEQQVNYVGSINNEYTIEMQITFGRDDDGGFLNGTYWYTDTNKPIEVSGDYNPYTKDVTILHYKDGQISETFLGKYGSDCRITGTWKKGEKELSFSIGEKAESITAIEEEE